MPRLLRINARHCDLHHLIALIPSEGKRLDWCAFPMGETMAITGDLSPLGTTAAAFGQQVDAAEAGVALDWDELTVLAGAVHQTIWGTFLGCKESTDFAELGPLFLDPYRYLDRSVPEFYRKVEIGFQAVDSFFWLVHARDNAVLERIGSAYTDVMDVDIGYSVAICSL